MATTPTPTTLLNLMFEVGRVVRRGAGSQTALVPLSCLEALRYISETDGASMQDVAYYLRVAAPSATGLVEVLARKGYLTRTTDRHDRRKVRLAVSAKGKILLARALRERTRTMGTLLKSLTVHERIEFARILTKLTSVSYA